MSDPVIMFDLGNDDTVEFVALPDGRISVEIDHRWEGDSETGFGRTLHSYLSAEHKRQLLEWLTSV